MTVSVGFYKKMHNWIIDEYTGEIVFRPFQVNGNPYKSKVLIVGITPEPLMERELDNPRIYADSLVDGELFEELNESRLKEVSREYKGVQNFVKYMKERYNEDVIISNVNCYIAEDANTLKKMKGLKNPLIVKGERIFREVVEEFSSPLIILQGTKTLKEFTDAFSEQLHYKTDFSLPIQEIENQGIFAELTLSNGNVCKVLACRSMSYFNKNGSKFEQLKVNIDTIIG